jgi:hypothetical protein
VILIYQLLSDLQVRSVSAQRRVICKLGGWPSSAETAKTSVQSAIQTGCSLSKLTLLQGAILANANLTGANLTRAYLRDVDLRETVSCRVSNGLCSVRIRVERKAAGHVRHGTNRPKHVDDVLKSISSEPF